MQQVRLGSAQGAIALCQALRDLCQALRQLMAASEVVAALLLAELHALRRQRHARAPIVQL
jgi:HEAT repeat protein